MTSEQKRKQITAMFGAYSKRLERLYDQFINRLTTLAHRVGIDVEDFLKKDGLFRFDKYPELRAEYNEIFKDYVQKEVLAYRAGITDGVALAYAHDASVLSGFSVLSNKAITQARNTAAETFIRSRMKPEKGLSLSQLVWNYASQTKSEFEVAVSNVIADGLRKGTSAASLGQMVRQYLKNPDMMYRRYHRTILDANGNKRDEVKWRRRVVDDDGRVRFVEEPLEKVGMGHYRSSKRNSDRLMRTEINSAYHNANANRWQHEPFVIGIQIDLSPQHPAPDECDDLKGSYPKNFIFIGWHPQCLCMSNPITIQGDEKKEFYRRLAAGEDMSGYVSPNAVREIPDKAQEWIDVNRKKFIGAGERGKLGYVWQENMQYIGKQFSKDELERMGFASKDSKYIPPRFETYSKEDEHVYASVKHQEKERSENIRMAAFLGNKTGDDIYLLPNIQPTAKEAAVLRNEYLPRGVKENKNPDFYFRGRFLDGKSMINEPIEDAKLAKRNIQNRLRDAFNQADDAFLEIPTSYQQSWIESAIRGKLNSASRYHTVYVKYGDELFIYEKKK